MPSKIQLDENLSFLYICLQKSDLKAIDFNAVGLATSLKPPAARMRYTRLKKQIESGALNAGHGPGFSSSSLTPLPPPPIGSSVAAAVRNGEGSGVVVKRKRRTKAELEEANRILPTRHVPRDGEDKKPRKMESPSQPLTIPAGTSSTTTTQDVKMHLHLKKSKAEPQDERRIKVEHCSGSEANFDNESESGSGYDSEDDMPLAKLCKRRYLSQGFGSGVHRNLVSTLAASSSPSSAGVVRAPVAKMSSKPVYSPTYGAFTTSPPAKYTEFGSLGRSVNGKGGGHSSPRIIERLRYVPLGFNPLALGVSSRNGHKKPDGIGFRDIGAGAGHYGGGVRGSKEFGGGVYTSPYAGWIDGRDYKSQMRNPGPGWESHARSRIDAYHQKQPIERLEQDKGLNQKVEREEQGRRQRERERERAQKGQQERQDMDLERSPEVGNEGQRKSI